MKKFMLLFLSILSISFILSFPVCAESYEDLTYERNGYGITITGCNKDAEDIVIPSEINGSPVTTIGMEAFYGTHNLNSIIIPEGVTKLDFKAFENSDVKNVTLPSTLKIIGGQAFNCCFDLTEINLPYGLEVIGGHAFANCQSLKYIDIPDSVYFLGEYAFRYCESAARA